MLRSLDTRGGQDIIFLNFQLFFVKKCNLLKTILTKKSEHIHYRFINEFCPDEDQRLVLQERSENILICPRL